MNFLVVLISCLSGISDVVILLNVQEQHLYVAYDLQAERKKVNQSTLVKSGWARGGNSIHITYDVCGHGNKDLPGFSDRTVPDTITFDSERFEYVIKKTIYFCVLSGNFEF